MSLALSFSRLCLQNVTKSLQRTGQSFIHTTSVTYGEPMKKKKRIDPQVIKARENRKRRKLEKAIRQLAKHARQLKPIDELEVSLTLLDEKEKRARPKPQLTEEEIDRRALLHKEWARYKHQEVVTNFYIIEAAQRSQEKALTELRKVSEELYQAAIQPDESLLPITVKGPVATPPIDNYDSPAAYPRWRLPRR